MSEAAAAPASAPSAPAPAANSGGGSAPPAVPPALVTTDSWHDFNAQLQARAKALKSQQSPSESAPNSPQPKGISNGLTAAEQDTTAGAADPAVPELGEQQPDPQQPQAPDEAAAAAAAADAALLDKVKAWLAGGDLPEELLKALVPMKNGDQLEYETLEEMKAGRMRLRDHTRAQQQRQREAAEQTQQIQAYQSHFEAIGDPETGGEAMYEIYSRNGMRKQLKQAAEKLALEEEEDRDLARGAMIAVMQRERIQDPNDHRAVAAFKRALAERERFREMDHVVRAKDERLQRLQQQQQVRNDEAAQAEFRATIDRQLAQLMPRAFSAVGLNDTDANRMDFRRNLAALYQQQGAQGLTQQLVADAARITREDLEYREQQRAQAANGNGRPAAPRPGLPTLGATGGGKIAGAQPQRGLTVEDYEAKFIRRGRR